MITLTIPEQYYRAFQHLRNVSDNKTKSRSYIYDNFLRITDQLTRWLYDQAPSSHKVIGITVNTVTLEPSDNPFGCYWTMIVLEKLSDHFHFGGLLERAINDP